MNKLFLSILICILFFLFIKSDGIIDYYSEEDHYKTLLSEKDTLDQELHKIQQQNRLLKSNTRYIEKVAREEYFYIYPDEIIISFK